MISYTTSAVYSEGTSYRKTESGSNSFSRAATNDYPGAAEFENGYPASFYYESGSGSAETIYGADGGITINGEGGEAFEIWGHEFMPPRGDTGVNSFNFVTSPDGEIIQQYWNTVSGVGGADRNTRSNINITLGGFTENINGRTFNNGRTFKFSETNFTEQTKGEKNFSNSGTQTFPTSSRQIQTTATKTFKYYPATTSSKTLSNKKGTTTTAGTITIPTTTGTSWTEIATTNTTKTKTSTVVSTTSEASHRSVITAHTIIILSPGEKFSTLKNSPAVGTPTSGTGNWESFQGPATLTISRWPAATYQGEVLDASVELYNSDASDTSSTKTSTQMQGVETANVTAFYKTTEGLPLGSSSFEGAGSKIKTSSVTYVAVSNPPPTAGTSSRVVVTQTATYNANIGGVAFPVNGKAETTNITETVPVFRSFATNESTVFGPTVTIEEGTPGEEDYYSYTEDIGYVENNAGGNSFAEEGNFFVSYGAHPFPNNGGISDAYLRRAYAWATVGDGTTATAVPKKSWTINGVSKVTWEAVSVSDGVATPWPSSGVETTTITQASASTTSTATATTAIWGNVYRRTTSSSNSSGVTTSENATPLGAGGNGHTMLQLGGLPSLPTPSYIPNPVGSVLPVFGAAHVSDKRTVIVLPAQYANTTVDNPITYSGSTLPETYFETQGNLEIALEGQGGAVSRLQSPW
jgi:hypothetical protein